jgi:hypothetical protein
MTLCIAWTRKNSRAEELIMATDSRLRSFGSWDCNPKIFTFSRTDCAMCFAGDTAFAYPMMIQLKNTIDANPKIRSRHQRLEVFKGIILNILNEMLEYKSDYELPAVSFIFGGYCWHRQEFLLWNLKYQKGIKKFTQHAIDFWKGIKGERKITFIGDYIPDAKKRLIEKLKANGKLQNGDFELEPFEVLRDMLVEGQKSDDYLDIGGAPQMLKIYKSLNTLPIAVKWTYDGVEKVTLLGHPLSEKAKVSNPILDPFELKLSNTNKYY